MLRRLLLFIVLGILCPASHGGQWIAVVAPDLRGAIEPLAQQRKVEGWEVTFLPAPGEDLAATLEKIAALANEPGLCCLLLAGDFAPGTGVAHVAPGRGTQLRMKEKPSDRPWALPAGKSKVPIQMGRLPARTAEEAATMVRKILEWPEQARRGGPFPAVRLVVGNHGAPAPFDRIADSLINGMTQRLVGRLPSAWRFSGMAHVNGSPWQGSAGDVPAVTRTLMTSPATILAYMGHSEADAAVSSRARLLSVQDWYRLPTGPPRTGLFFTCGCHSCNLTPEVESFGFAAMRAPGGPAAVIGSHGETYAAMGYLAIAGMLKTLSADNLPLHLGTLWLGAQEGLAKGDIDPAEFTMLDTADGTGGRVPLDAQRLEHLESWMLLGDPAMPIVPAIPTIRLSAPATPLPGKAFTVTGELPESLAGASLRVTFERHPGTIRTDLPPVPSTGNARLEATRERRRLSQDVNIASVDVTARGRSFTATLPLPPLLPPSPWTVRAVCPDRLEAGGGVLRIP